METKPVKQIRKNGRWPEMAWGYGPLSSRHVLTIEERDGKYKVCTDFGSHGVLDEAEARKVAEVALRTVNLKKPDYATQMILYKWGLLADPPVPPPRRTPQPAPFVPERGRRVGFSEIPALMGLSRYMTPLKLWRLKTGLDQPEPETFPMRWGKEAEGVALRLAMEELGMRDWRVRRQYPAADGSLAGYLDALACHRGKHAVLEVKVLSTLSSLEAYRAQVNAQMGASGVHTGYLCVVHMNRELIIEEVPFSRDVYDYQKRLAEDFMQLVLTNTPPVPEAFKRPQLDGKLVLDEDDEISRKIAEYLALQEQIRPLEERLEAIKDELKLLMDTSRTTKIITPAGVASLTEIKRNSFNSRKFKEEHSEVYEKYVETSVVKTLKISK